MTNSERKTVARRLLNDVPLFSGLDEQDLGAILDISQFRHMRAGEALFEAGESCSAIYVLESGLMKLFVRGPKSQQKVIEFVEPGDSFAEAALFSGEGYPVSAEVMTDATILSIDAFGLSRLLRARPGISWNMLSILSRRSHQLVSQLRSATLHTAEQRVAQYLLEHYDDEIPEAPVGHLPNRRSELACALGITPETLCRVLGKLRKNGWVETVNSKIYIRSPQQLAEVLVPVPVQAA